MTLISEFTFLETLRSGSYGNIVLARHVRTNETKTIKMIGARTLADSRKRRVMETEKNVMAAMGAFPFVARLEYFFRDAAWTYLVMPMVFVGTLLDVMAELGPVDETTARFFAAQVR